VAAVFVLLWLVIKTSSPKDGHSDPMSAAAVMARNLHSLLFENNREADDEASMAAPPVGRVASFWRGGQKYDQP
jgi:hypothetical protein